MNRQSHYFLSSIFVYDGTMLKVAMTRALVSRSGVYKVFEENEEIHRAFLEARIYKVRLDGYYYQARLVRESGPEGTHYNLRLIDVQDDLGQRLQELLGRFGFESPWKRNFARIAASPLVRQVEVPMAGLLVLFSGEASVDISNFSYHGLFVELECACPSMGEAVGGRIRFKIVTSRGRILDECTGRIARIYDEMVGQGQLQRGLGIRITDMSESARKIYHGMILESCREIQKTGSS